MSLKKKNGETVDCQQFTINIIQKLRVPCQLCVIHALQSPLLQFNTFFHITWYSMALGGYWLGR
jgi:hypothetical protein